jgi:hypothetical protein
MPGMPPSWKISFANYVPNQKMIQQWECRHLGKSSAEIIFLIRNGRAAEMPGMPPSWKIIFVNYILIRTQE